MESDRIKSFLEFGSQSASQSRAGEARAPYMSKVMWRFVQDGAGVHPCAGPPPGAYSTPQAPELRFSPQPSQL